MTIDAAPQRTATTTPIVIMGVAGCGKTVVGEQLAVRLGCTFIEGDRLHPPENVARMRSGEPLTDRLREGWLDAVGAALSAEISAGRGAVAACSALKRKYRDRIRALCPAAVFVHLDIDKQTARERVGRRTGHFMPASLVDSQFADLQPLQTDEAGVTLDGALGVEKLVELAAEAICAGNAMASEGPVR